MSSNSSMSLAKKIYNIKELERLGISPEIEQSESVLKFISLLVENNEECKFFPQKDMDNLFVKHFCDSLQLLLLFGFKKNATILDIGAGGGFPSIPNSVFRPDLKFTLVESNRKKSSFLKNMISELGVENSISVINKKIEKVDNDIKYDYVICRGFDTLNKVADLGKPFISESGRIYTFRTKEFESELSDITSKKKELGICVSEIAEYDLGKLITGLNLVALELFSE